MEKKYEADADYMATVQALMTHPRVLEMSAYPHHGKVDCLSHSIDVSYTAYQIGRILKLDFVALARGGLLHDLYLYDWHIKGDRRGLHGFTHAKNAYHNAKDLIDLTDKEKDMILKHMWPLNASLPKYKETFILMVADRYCTIKESIISRQQKKEG